jgi:dienelactone hydrolase
MYVHEHSFFATMRTLNTILFVLMAATLAQAQTNTNIRTETILYTHSGTELEGFVAYPTVPAGQQAPVVIVVHDWAGPSEYTQRRCKMLAELGYVAFAADIYGKGVRPQGMEACAAQATKYRNDRALMRGRINAALAKVRTLPQVDGQKVACLGYCFGGGVSLELARSGADVRGVASFHGSLETPNMADARNIRCKVAVFHGAVDPYVPADQVATFQKEMNEANVDYQFTAYSGAVHAFTQPQAGNDPSGGAAYNAAADRRSWDALKLYLQEIFQ